MHGMWEDVADGGGADADAEQAWVLRYSDPAQMAALTALLGDIPGAQTLRAFMAWREQRLDEAATATLAIGYDETVPHRWRSRALAVRAGLLSELGLIKESFGVREEALEQARLAHDVVGEIACVHGFGVLYEHSDPQRAQQQYLQAVRLCDNARDATQVVREQLDGVKAVAVVNLFALEGYHDLPVPAWVPQLPDVLPRARVSWPEMAAVITAMLADEEMVAGDLAEAARLLDLCPDPTTMRDVALSPSVARSKARLLAAQGDVEAGVSLLETLAERLPPRHLPEALETLMELHEDAGDPAKALAVAKRLVLATRRQHDSSSAAAVRALEVLYRTENAEEEARRAAREARAASQTLGSLQEETTRDDLTGVRNRRYLHSVAQTVLAHHGAAMAVIDIDQFKQVNDEHGHVVGDAVLRRVASALTAATRPEDVVARLGGDEFVVLRPAGGGDTLAADLAAATHLDPVDGGARTPAVTLSIGVADTRSGWDATYPVADAAMYDVKRAGGAAIRRLG